MLAKIKPVLRKNLNHYSQNVILTFKSVEIMIFEVIDGKRKVYTPLYIPLQHLKELQQLSAQELEVRLLSNIKYQNDNNQFIYNRKETKSKNGKT